VTIPANAEALMTGFGKSLDAEAIKIIKSFDVGATAADVTEVSPAGAPLKKGRVVRLDAPARDRAKPFVIQSIKRTGMLPSPR
jgi:hypothetical protein